MCKAIAAITLASLLSGCAYLGSRARDLGDIVRLEGSIGVGLQANVNAGELAHLGIGSSRRSSAGWAYGMTTSERRVEDHFPLSYVESLVHPQAVALHGLTMGEGSDAVTHRCPVLASGALSSGSVRKPDMQFWSLEIGVMIVAVGAEIGFNPAELVDFILGVFTIDVAGDDAPEGRARRGLWIPAAPVLHSER